MGATPDTDGSTESTDSAALDGYGDVAEHADLAVAMLRLGYDPGAVEDVVMILHGEDRYAAVPGEHVADAREIAVATCDRWTARVRDDPAALGEIARERGVLVSEVMIHARGVCEHRDAKAEDADLNAAVRDADLREAARILRDGSEVEVRER